ncbi:hypothetical protein CLAIMM_05163 [Cladophialophora immunda]|nr:hypothetical protein CLAIMM_05163 [Cladophialophora immunda]
MVLPLSLPTIVVSLSLFLLQGLCQDPSTVTVIGTTITQTFTAAASTTPLSPQYTDSLTFRESILNSTNFYRYEHSAGYIYWNETLASYAQEYSQNCVWAHSHGPRRWGNERALYNFSNSDPTGFTEATGHFTQLVWQGTQATGCGWTDCNGKNGLDGVYLVCEYWPPGNIVGENNLFFKANVDSERSSGDSGFDELSATMGATGGTPTSTGSALNPPAATASSTGESIGAPMVEMDRRGLLVTVCVTVAAVLFGLGMS